MDEPRDVAEALGIKLDILRKRSEESLSSYKDSHRRAAKDDTILDPIPTRPIWPPISVPNPPPPQVEPVDLPPIEVEISRAGQME